MADQILSPDHAWTSRAIKSAHGHLIANQYLAALPPKADICSALAHVCFGPIADIAVTFVRPSGKPTSHRRRDRGHDLFRGNDGTGVVGDVEVESGAHHLVREIG